MKDQNSVAGISAVHSLPKVFARLAPSTDANGFTAPIEDLPWTFSLA